MDQVDRAVLDKLKRQLFGDGILDEVLDAAVARLTPAKSDLVEDRVMLTRALQRLGTEVQNFTAAIAAGGELKVLVEALKVREAEGEQLRRRIPERTEVTLNSTPLWPRQLEGLRQSA